MNFNNDIFKSNIKLGKIKIIIRKEGEGEEEEEGRRLM